MAFEITNETAAVSDGLNWRTFAARGLETLIGGILLIAGLLKAWEPLSFIQQIADYKIITAPGAVKALAWMMIAIECGLGTALMAGFRRRITVPLAGGLFVVFLGAVGWAWASGATEDCGCFGSWVKRTPAEAFTEDLLMLAALVGAWFLHRFEPRNYQRLRLGLIGVAMLTGLAVTAWSSQSDRQSSDPVVRLQTQPQSPFQGLAVVLEPTDLSKGTHLVILMDTGCSHCQAAVPAFNQLKAQSRNTPPLLALCMNTEADVRDFKNNYHSEFPIGIIDRATFMQILGTGGTPHTLLVKEGMVTKIWDGNIPNLSELVSEAGR